MGNLGLYKIECLHILGTSESRRLKVSALNLWEARQPFGYEELPVPPTRLPLPFFKKLVFLYYDMASWQREVGRDFQSS